MKVMDVNAIQYDCKLIKQSPDDIRNKYLIKKYFIFHGECEFEMGGNISAMGGSP